MELLESSDLILAGLCNLEEKTLSLLPSKAGIGDGFSINMIMDLLAAIFDVALDHQSFDQFVDVVAVTAAVKYFFYQPRMPDSSGSSLRTAHRADGDLRSDSSEVPVRAC